MIATQKRKYISPKTLVNKYKLHIEAKETDNYGLKKCLFLNCRMFVSYTKNAISHSKI